MQHFFFWCCTTNNRDTFRFPFCRIQHKYLDKLLLFDLFSFESRSQHCLQSFVQNIYHHTHTQYTLLKSNLNHFMIHQSQTMIRNLGQSISIKIFFNESAKNVYQIDYVLNILYALNAYINKRHCECTLWYGCLINFLQLEKLSKQLNLVYCFKNVFYLWMRVPNKKWEFCSFGSFRKQFRLKFMCELWVGCMEV